MDPGLILTGKGYKTRVEVTDSNKHSCLLLEKYDGHISISSLCLDPSANNRVEPLTGLHSKGKLLPLGWK